MAGNKSTPSKDVPTGTPNTETRETSPPTPPLEQLEQLEQREAGAETQTRKEEPRREEPPPRRQPPAEDFRSMRLRPSRDELLFAVESLNDDEAAFMLEELARRLNVPLGKRGVKGSTPTGKYIARVQLNVKPMGEERVRIVKVGECVALEEDDVERFRKKQPSPIDPELV